MEYVATKIRELRKNARETLGIELQDPFMTISFMSLPVIPSLKITDKGLFDVNLFKFVSLYLD